MADYICLIRGFQGEPGLCIEFKRGTEGKQSPNQIEFEDKIKGQGYVYIVARSTQEAMDIFNSYLGLN